VDFDLTPEQELIRETVRTFARERVEPVAAELDLTSRFPYELVAELGELGLMGLPIPEQYGGAGRHGFVRDRDQGSSPGSSSSVAITVAAHASLGIMPILNFGSERRGALAARSRLGSATRGLRSDRARCRFRCGSDTHDRRASRRLVGE
jgi:alkylation response protein AidB-like acyl-CoA dehydrogenase